MKYYTVRPANYGASYGIIYDTQNHPLYSKCTLYEVDNKGLCVVQERFNRELKMKYWAPIDIWLVDMIYEHPKFSKYFEEVADCKDENGLYPTRSVRQVMWALRMKPLKREYWEIERFT